MKNNNIQIQPVISEKSYNQANALNKYIFMAPRGINKIEIQKMIETKYKVTVVKINSIVRPGKSFRNWKSNKTYRKSDLVKYVATLKKGDKIDEFLSK